jgi:hypothetical protein
MKANVAIYLKFAVALIAFVAWVVLIGFHVQGAGELIDFIKYILFGLAVHLLGTSQQAPSFPTAPSTTTVTTS